MRIFFYLLALCCAHLISIDLYSAEQQNSLIRYNFDNLDNWEPLYFSNIKKHTKYNVKKNSILTVSTNESASGLLCKHSFSPYEYDFLQWRWKLDNVFFDLNPHEKSGDDYPLRILIVFEEAPKELNFLQKTFNIFNNQKTKQSIPHSTLEYVWSGKQMKRIAFKSPYSDKVKIIPLQSGIKKVGVWVHEKVNILEDYYNAFGEFPPKHAKLAIMGDSDNAVNISNAHLDYLTLSHETQTNSLSQNSSNSITLEKMCKERDKKYPNIKHISVMNYLKFQDKIVMVDVRPVNERNISMIPGAITSEQLGKNPNLYKNKTLLTYCTVGDRSSKYAKKLLSKGFKNVANLRGGVLKWAENGRKFVSPEGKETTKVHVYGKTWNLLPEGYTGVW